MCFVWLLIALTINTGSFDISLGFCPEDRLKWTCQAMKKLKVAAVELLKCLIPSKDVPTNLYDLVRTLRRASVIMKEWKQTAARQGACVAWTLVRSHHPSLDIGAASKGLPHKHCDGRPFTDLDREAIIAYVRSYATRAGSLANVGIYVPDTKTSAV